MDKWHSNGLPLLSLALYESTASLLNESFCSSISRRSSNNSMHSSKACLSMFSEMTGILVSGTGSAGRWCDSATFSAIFEPFCRLQFTAFDGLPRDPVFSCGDWWRSPYSRGALDRLTLYIKTSLLEMADKEWSDFISGTRTGSRCVGFAFVSFLLAVLRPFASTDRALASFVTVANALLSPRCSRLGLLRFELRRSLSFVSAALTLPCLPCSSEPEECLRGSSEHLEVWWAAPSLFLDSSGLDIGLLGVASRGVGEGGPSPLPLSNESPLVDLEFRRGGCAPKSLAGSSALCPVVELWQGKVESSSLSADLALVESCFEYGVTFDEVLDVDTLPPDLRRDAGSFESSADSSSLTRAPISELSFVVVGILVVVAAILFRFLIPTNLRVAP